MNRKNLTAAVLAGLAGAVGLAGAAQAGVSAAVNLNPDGLGEVLIYPYYTTNDDNTTLMTVVNTTDVAKAVKVRFLEAYNSREVLDFNLYLSPWDVWVAALADSAAFGAEAGVPHIFIPDTSCTVPYLYGDAFNEDLGGGLQAFLPYAFTGNFEDGGPTDISRTSEGYIEVIEMGTMTDGDGVAEDELEDAVGEHAARDGSATAATHVIKEDDDGNEYVEPENCQLLVENWTQYRGNVTKPHPLAGWWLDEAVDNCGEDRLEDVDRDDVGTGNCGQTDGITIGTRDLDSTETNSGGLFGGAAIINVPKGTMFSYDAKAIQGYDTTSDGVHFYPGTIHPSMNDGSTDHAVVFLGAGNQAFFSYDRPVDAISALFMHETLANTYVIEEAIAAGTEWVMTLPTKSWYVDTELTGEVDSYYIPDEDDVDCLGWDPDDDPNPFRIPANGGTYGDGGEECPANSGSASQDWEPGCDFPEDYPNCTPIKVTDKNALSPFTEAFNGESCDAVVFKSWDREESPTVQGGDIVPPIVSPAPPIPPGPEGTPFELCYEVNVLRFGDTSVFGTESDILYTVAGTADAGWARITMDGELESDGDDTLVGLPITGFSAEQYTNGELEGGVLANYGGLFGHKGSVCVIDAGDADSDCDSGYVD
jgi:hypothetical protein